MNIAELLLSFMDKQNPTIIVCQCQADMESLNIIAIELLSWLKLEHKRTIWMSQGRKTALKPMMLNYAYPWCNRLKDYVQNEPVFTNVFRLEGDYLSFRSDISEEYKQKTRQFAFDNYNPGMVIG